MSLPKQLEIATLQQQYRSGTLTPIQLVNLLDTRIGENGSNPIWIIRLSLQEMLPYAERLEKLAPDSLPLYGIPFAIKDNIDLAGSPTTAACPDYTYVPEKSATVVQQLIDAGAIPVGKTNLDQFATGLVGTRSPYGACRNVFNPDYISGGSSSGSAVAVALGLASFSLGTDTAGSGRVPAAFNNLIGHKPTCGLISTQGVVPACRTLDCVSIFANTANDAATVLGIAKGFDVEDPYSRKEMPQRTKLGERFRFGVPQSSQLEFFGNSEAATHFSLSVGHLIAMGGEAITIDFEPFLETARLLYEGPWVAERYAAIRNFIENQPEALFPVTRQIIVGATKFSATDTFNALYRLKALQRQSQAVWDDIEVLVTPTTGTIFTLAEVEAEPVKCNSQLGYYTNFMNLLDMSAIAIPTGFNHQGLPLGITVSAPAWSDDQLLDLAQRYQTGK